MLHLIDSLAVNFKPIPVHFTQFSINTTLVQLEFYIVANFDDAFNAMYITYRLPKLLRGYLSHGPIQALTGSDFQLRVGSGSELKSRVVGYPRVG